MSLHLGLVPVLGALALNLHLLHRRYSLFNWCLCFIVVFWKLNYLFYWFGLYFLIRRWLLLVPYTGLIVVTRALARLPTTVLLVLRDVLRGRSATLLVLQAFDHMLHFVPFS